MPSASARTSAAYTSRRGAPAQGEECRVFLSGAAPITLDTLNYFGSLTINIVEVYGMSENTGPQTCGKPSWFKAGTCGTTCNTTQSAHLTDICADRRRQLRGVLLREAGFEREVERYKRLLPKCRSVLTQIYFTKPAVRPAQGHVT